MVVRAPEGLPVLHTGGLWHPVLVGVTVGEGGAVLGAGDIATEPGRRWSRTWRTSCPGRRAGGQENGGTWASGFVHSGAHFLCSCCVPVTMSHADGEGIFLDAGDLFHLGRRDA